jgi:ABC-type oligopeptide transport system substrate-binding subunit
LWEESLSPGNEQRGYWGSLVADQPGSRNLIGIKNPTVDKLVDRVVFAKSRDELVAATKALDRVLLWNNYIVPHWSNGKLRAARWDRFSHPDKLPEYGASAYRARKSDRLPSFKTVSPEPEPLPYCEPLASPFTDPVLGRIVGRCDA